jgi:hypothetical protein
VAKTAPQLGLKASLRPRDRPRKRVAEPASLFDDNKEKVYSAMPFFCLNKIHDPENIRSLDTCRLLFWDRGDFVTSRRFSG